MNQLLDLLKGNKTYLTAIAMAISTLACKYGYIAPDQYATIFNCLLGAGFIFLRMGMNAVQPGSGDAVQAPDPQVAPPPMPQSNQDLVSALAQQIAAALKPAAPKPPPSPPAAPPGA